MTSPGGSVGLVAPRYGDGALSDLVPSVLAALGVPGESDRLGLPSARRYVVLLVDALGWELLRRHVDDAPYLGSLLDGSRPLTSGVPSTTATSLACVGTGLVPGQHGVVGYTMAVPGTDQLLNTLRWDTTVEPRRWQPYPTAFERADDHGVAMTSVAKKAFRGSGITVAGLRGGAYLEADSVGQRTARVTEACERSDRSLVYVYEGDLDWTGHREGCDSAALRDQLAVIDAAVARTRRALPSDAVLVVTGDHGMVDIPFTARLDVESEPALCAGVRLVGGDPRLRYLYTEDGAADDVAGVWRQRLAEHGAEAIVVTRAEAIERGWFGTVEERVRDRLGDVIIASMGRTAVECKRYFPNETKLLGWHGSLTADEMLVPLLIAT